MIKHLTGNGHYYEMITIMNDFKILNDDFFSSKVVTEARAVDTIGNKHRHTDHRCSSTLEIRRERVG